MSSKPTSTLMTGSQEQTDEEVQELYSAGWQIMADAGMNLTKWTCSSAQVSGDLSKVLADDVSVCKVLGVRWNPQQDTLVYETTPLCSDSVITKRILLSIIARLFDPVGFVSPVVMQAKIMFQQLWSLGLKWDEVIPSEMQDQISVWLQDLSVLRTFRIPRSYFTHGWLSSSLCTLHVFGDASEKAYGACAYLVVETGGVQQASLVISRA